MNRICIYLAFVLFASPAFAADVNGYTAQYECKSGGTYCNVDVATLAAQACQQTIAAGDAWATINWSNNVICLANGDHTAKGTLTLGASGTSGTRKILRYYRSGDTDDEPWSQTSGNQAKISRLDANGQDYWIIHRLTFPVVSNTEHIVATTANSTNLIFNRIYSTGFYGSSEGHILIQNTTSVTVQNSVIANSSPAVNMTPAGVLFGGTTDTHIVNNEIYDVGKSIFTWSTGSTEYGPVVENNDMYLTSAYYTSSGTKSAAEGFWTTKANGSSTSPWRVIHNRTWGMRPCDTSVACDGGGDVGYASHIGGGGAAGDYVLYQNNIDTDSEGFLDFNNQQVGSLNNISVIGNLFYKFATYLFPNAGLEFYSCCGGGNDAIEIYLNTIINANNTAWLDRGGATNIDVRCNAIISSLAASGSWGTGGQMDYNVYYDTTDSGETNKITNNISSRANSTAYSLGTIIRTGAISSCSVATDTACFLYRVTTAGTSAGSNPGYTTTLGGTTTDGTMVVKAIRGPHSFKRKLRTNASGETYVIPYAKVHTSAPEYQYCTTSSMGSALGSRTGIGINNDTAGF